jgi:hypothetical protein
MATASSMALRVPRPPSRGRCGRRPLIEPPEGVGPPARSHDLCRNDAREGLIAGSTGARLRAFLPPSPSDNHNATCVPWLWALIRGRRAEHALRHPPHCRPRLPAFASNPGGRARGQPPARSPRRAPVMPRADLLRPRLAEGPFGRRGCAELPLEGRIVRMSERHPPRPRRRWPSSAVGAQDKSRIDEGTRLPALPHCASCHAFADGLGPWVPTLRSRLPDLSRLAEKHGSPRPSRRSSGTSGPTWCVHTDHGHARLGKRLYEDVPPSPRRSPRSATLQLIVTTS